MSRTPSAGCLGEQSAKALRGGEMADVIFNGTDGRKPMGMGEVSLTLGGVGEESLKRGRRGSGLRRGDADAPDFPRRRQRIFSEPHALPAQGHPAVVHGHGRRAHQLQHPGARPHHADSLQQAGRSPDDFRGGGGHHQIQVAEKGIAAQTGIHRAEPSAHRRHHQGSEAADRLAATPGRQGAALQADSAGTAAPGNPIGAASV